MSGYAFTRDSIPFIFSSEWNNNEGSFVNYSTEAFNNSKFFQALSDANYEKSFFDNDFTWLDEKALQFNNVVALNEYSEVSVFNLAQQEIKYMLFKYLPHPLKRFSHVWTMDFSWATINNNKDLFIWDDITFCNEYLEQDTITTDNKYFQYIHIAGAHVPFDTSENLEYLPYLDGTYEQELTATMKSISKYIEHLKESNAYDNTTIVVMADHGYWHEGSGRQNPILYIKGKGETHHAMHTSSKQVSYEDLCDTFIELLNGKDSTEIFSDIPSEGRIRRFMWNGFNEEEHMIEYEQTGKAWDTTTLLPTGKEFNL